MLVRFLFFSLWLVASIPGQQAPRAWMPDDVVNQERTSDWTLSDDGRKALWLKWRADKEKDKHVATLMLSEVPGGDHRALTVGRHDISQPRFSPGGRLVSFVSSRAFPDGAKDLPKNERGSQIWALDLRGGEARPLTKVPFGVRSYQWIDDGTILLTARGRKSRRELEATERKDKSRVVEDDDAFGDSASHLYRFDVEEKKTTRMWSGREPIQSFTASPDGRRVVALHGRSASFRAESDVPPRCLLHDLDSGESEELFTEQRSKPGRFAWSPDGSALWCRVPRSTVDGEDWAAIETVRQVDPVTRQVTLVSGNLSVRGFFIPVAEGLLVGASRGVRPDAVLLKGEGRGVPVESEGTVFQVIKARNSDRVLWITGDASTPDSVMAGRIDVTAESVKLIDSKVFYRPNDGFEKLALAKTEIVRWKGAEDDEIEGILYYPHDYREGEKRPLVLVTHGGPHAADLDRFTERWANSPNLYAGRGAFVLKVNYHGSSDYGLAFGESIKGRYYELEVIDLLTGIKHLEDRGLVDRERLGLVGWSNGAILSTATLAYGHRYAPTLNYDFKACAPGAGDVNWTSDYGNCAFGAGFDEFYLGGTPWNNTAGYLAKSPLMEVERITTPTIIFFGTEDTAVPTEQGWQWYRALHRVGKAPVRFLLFPGEGHGLRKLTHQRRKLVEELAWFDRHLFDEEPEPPLVKEGSPLDLAIRRRGESRVGVAYGVTSGGALVPETVSIGELEVGRFEVTRAQWAFFDDSEAAVDRENEPKVGITADQARAYVAWLNDRTGERWRLLTAEEQKKLPRGSRENTLDRWAGYAPSDEDAARLRSKVAELGVETVLEEVGTAPPGTYREGARRVMIHDAGGNAAEWVRDGEVLKAVGDCALTSPGSSASDAPPAALIGLRVAKSK